MIFAFLLASGLDMSLPEFTPQVDLSGNYIVSEFDVSTGESSADLISSEELAEVGLSPSAELRSAESYLTTSILQGYGFITSDGTPRIIRDSSRNIRYVQLSVGYIYTFSSDAPRIWLSYSLENDSPITEVTSPIQVEQTAYLCVLDTRYLNVISQPVSIPDDPSGNDPSGNDPSGGDFDDTNIVQGLNELKDLVDVKFRVLIFLVLINFSYPVVVSICKNIVGGKS